MKFLYSAFHHIWKECYRNFKFIITEKHKLLHLFANRVHQLKHPLLEVHNLPQLLYYPPITHVEHTP